VGWCAQWQRAARFQVMKFTPAAVIVSLGLWSSAALAECPGQSGSADPGQSGSASYFDPGQSGSAAPDPGQSGSSGSDPGQSGSAASDPGQSGSAQPPAQERVSREQRTGVVIRNERLWLVTKSDVHPIDEALIPPGQMMNEDGDLLTAPLNVTTLDPAAAPSRGGVVLQGETAYLIHGGRAIPLNASTVPEGMILTFEGELLKAPKRAMGVP
jgi:hypothetical protein